MTTDAVLLARVSGSLLAVLALILLAARFARRTTRGRHGGELRVRERVGLSRETSAVVLETAGRLLLVGVSPGQVSLLADLGPAELDAGSAADDPAGRIPAPRAPLEPGVRVHAAPLSRKVVRELDRGRRKALPPTQRGSGSVLDPRTWQQGVEALRDLTARRG